MSNISEWAVFLGGVHSIGFAIFHVFFWKLFKWDTELKKVNLPTRAITQLLNIVLIAVFLLVSSLCFFFPNELLTTKMGNFLLASFAFIWFVRLIGQFIFLRINHPTIHVLTVLFILGIVLFIIPLLRF